MSGPRITSGLASKQNYATPPEFIAAVERRFGKLDFDLAADESNHQTPRWFGPGGEQPDALAATWPSGRLWLNPPFANVTPWVKKCAQHTGEIFLLVTASVGANWFRDYVAPCADVYLLSGRLCFDGKNVFPKDCIIARFPYMGQRPTIYIWGWQSGRLYSPWSG